MPPKRGLAEGSVAAKRHAAKVSSIRKKQQAGQAHGGERALIRVGTSVTNVLTGADDLSDWSDEELERGQRKDKNGRFTGKRPTVVPTKIHDELTKRRMRTANKLLSENLPAAVEMLVSIATDGEVEDKDRLRAINMVLERVMGKTPDKVQFEGDAPWMLALNAGIIRVEATAPEPEEEDEEIG